MILENTKFIRNNYVKIIRICDECGKKEEAYFASVKRGRRLRGGDIDLCVHCSYSRKYIKPKRGKQHHSWKHGLINGYKRITLEDGTRIFEHRYVYEQYFGRKLNKKERIHHIDFNKANNDIDNLILFENNGSHRGCHQGSMEICSLFFLDKEIWFNFKIFKYVFKYDEFCKRKNIKINIISQLHHKRRKIHLLIVEKIIGRRLYYGEVVHHIDGNYPNNDPNNLIVLSRKNHLNAHYSLQKCTAELFKKGIVGFNKEEKEYYLI